MRKKNCYAFPDNFEKSINKLIVKRLKSDLKVKLPEKPIFESLEGKFHFQVF
jgi:hypothetical protein